jgi:hypothetical protein
MFVWGCIKTEDFCSESDKILSHREISVLISFNHLEKIWRYKFKNK